MKKILILLLLLGISAYGCGGGGSTSGDASSHPTPINPGQVAKVELTTSSRIVQTGNTIQLIARALDGNGKGVPGVAIVFTSSGVGTLSSNYQITNSDGYAYAGVFSSVAGSATVRAFNQNLSHSLDVYFADGEIKNKLKLSVDRNGNNVFDEPADFTVSGTTGERVKIKATYTDGGGAPLANKTIKVFSNSTSVVFENSNLKTDNYGNASTFMTFVNQLNTIYIDVVGEADDGTVGSVSLKVQTFVLGEILIYADKVSIKTDETATITACLYSDLGQPIKMKGIKINFEVSPTDAGEILPFAFTDENGCAKNTFKPLKDGNTKVIASFTDKKSELTIKVAKVVKPLTVIPSSPSVKRDSTVPIMITGGVAPYTVTSLHPDLTDPDTWAVANDGATFTVKGVAEGTATLVVKDSANTIIQVTLTITQ